MEQTKAGIVLVADPDLGFLQKLNGDARARAQAPALVSTRTDFETRLRTHTEGFSGIFVNPGLCDPGGVPLIKIARQLCPTTPLFYIVDGNFDIFSNEEMSKLTVLSTFKKPLSFQDIQIAIEQASKVFDPKAALSAAPTEVELMDVEFEEGDEAFLPIRAKSFMSGRESYFDVYVRLNPTKYLKILKAGDSFSPERINGYLLKGLEHFYLRRKAQEHYLRFCDTLTTAVLRKKNLSLDVKAAQVMNHGEEAASFLKAGGFNEGALNYARRFSKNVHCLIKDLKLDRVDVVRNYMQNNKNADHAVSTVMIASLLAIPLRFDSEKSTSIVGLSALLHDIGLERVNPAIRYKDESLMNKDELAEFQQHPTYGFHMLNSISGLEPIIPQAVAQHHERRTGHGYPNRLGASAINLVAEIIGISEELVKQMERAQQNPSLNVLKEMEEKYFNGFSSSVVNTLKLFLK